jgi:hypothetical protein
MKDQTRLLNMYPGRMVNLSIVQRSANSGKRIVGCMVLSGILGAYRRVLAVIAVRVLFDFSVS